MIAPTPDGAIRLGHGAVMDFSGGEGTAGIIPPDRARLSGLAYLALGDWHGCLQIGPATWYSGTPEADSFKHIGGLGLAGGAGRKGRGASGHAGADRQFRLASPRS